MCFGNASRFSGVKSGILWWDTSSEKDGTQYVTCLSCGFLDEDGCFEECDTGKPGLSAAGIVLMSTSPSSAISIQKSRMVQFDECGTIL